MTDIEKMILENQEAIMLAIGNIMAVQQNYKPNDIRSKLMDCYEETRGVLGKKKHVRLTHSTET